MEYHQNRPPRHPAEREFEFFCDFNHTDCQLVAGRHDCLLPRCCKEIPRFWEEIRIGRGSKCQSTLNPAPAELEASALDALNLDKSPMAKGVKPETNNRKSSVAKRPEMLKRTLWTRRDCQSLQRGCLESSAGPQRPSAEPARRPSVAFQCCLPSNKIIRPSIAAIRTLRDPRSPP
jgi:hypothetical protein